MTKDRLADLLLKTGMLNQENLTRAMDAQKMHGGDLGRTMVDLGLISEETLVRAYATLYSMQAVTISPQKLDAEVAKMLPKPICEQWGVIPFRVDQGKKYLDIAQSDPTNLDATDEIRRATKYTVRFFLATRSGIANAINFAFYSDNIANVGMGNEVEFTFGGEQPGGAQVAVDRGTSPRGGFMQGTPGDYNDSGGIPLMGTGDATSFQPPSDQKGVSFTGSGASGALPMETTSYGGPPANQMMGGQSSNQLFGGPSTDPAMSGQGQQPVMGGTSSEATFDQSGIRQIRQAPPSSRPVHDELLDMKLGRTGNLEEEKGPREIQIDLNDSGGEKTSPGRPPPIPNDFLGGPTQQDIEALQSTMDRLEDAISMNRAVLENLLRALIKKRILTREEAMAVVKTNG